MLVTVNLYSQKKGEVNRFLSHFYNTDFDMEDSLSWEKKYANPIELAEIVGTFIDNFEDFDLTMWISLDKNVFVHITEENADDIIKYLYERFPY
ncbi:MAG: hypothetical protein HFJ35_05320 [Clostridia bacterium]|nr:hypothetical protein [Clostridia bacterium]